MNNVTPSPYEAIKRYQALGLEKSIFLESKYFDRIAIQAALASYLLLTLCELAVKFYIQSQFSRSYYISAVLGIVLLIFIAKPSLAPARFFYLIKYYPLAIFIITIRFLFINSMDWVWYGRVLCVLVSVIACPAYIKYLKHLRSSRKQAIQEILNNPSVSE